MSCTDHLLEIESLRLQVTDLSRALAEREQSMSAERRDLEETIRNLREQSQLLRTIVNGTAAETGDEFFASLVTHLTSALHVQYAIIGEVSEDQPKRIRTIAVSTGGTLVGNFEYDLAHTPCATTLMETFACFNRDIQATFPQFQPLVDLGAESYCAVSLRTKGGAVVGLLVVMDTKPLQQADRLQALLRVLAPRVAVELERKRAERERSQALADLHNVVETVPDILFTLDNQGHLVKWNRRVVDVTGYSPEELLNMPALAFVPPEEQANTAAAIQRAFTEGYAELEGHMLTRDHRLIPYHWTGAALKDPRGLIIGITGVGRDVSEKQRAEESLRHNRALLQSFVEHTPAAVAMLDENLKYVMASKRWCQDYRLGDRDIVGLHHYDVFPEIRKMEHWQAIHRRCLAGETVRNDEDRFYREDGKEDWLRWEVRPWVNESGSIGGIIMFTEVITARKQAEEALRRSEHQLRTVLDALPVGVWFTDQSGKPVLSNPAARQIWSDIKQVGIETAVDNSGWWETVGPTDAFHRWALSQSLTKRVSTLNETFDFECLDGTKKTIRNTTVPVRDEAGGLYGAIVVNEDVTALRQMHGALKLTQSSVDQAVEGFLWIDSDACILNVNDATCRMLEYTRDELTTMTMHDIDPNFPPELWAAQWEELKREGSMTFESKYWSKTGRVLDTEVTVTCLDYEGRQYICAIMRDIGERKRAEMTLRASEERYRSLYDDTPTMYFTLATDGTVRSVNRFGADQLGYQVEELIGHSVLDIFHEDDKNVVAARLTDCLRTPDIIQEWEFRKVRKDGRVIWVRETARVGQSFTGETIVLVTCENITDRKRMEETLCQRERDLHIAEEERERISQDLHDGILQSLFAVGLVLESAKSKMSPRTRKTAGTLIDQAIAQLNRVMQEVRNFIAGLDSNLLNGKDLPRALKQMLDSLSQTHATHVRLAIEARATQSLSAEQSLHLFHVIQEAVSNCIRHGRAQEATVSLKMLKQGVRLSIRDNGAGFNPKAVRHEGHGLTNMAARAKKIGARFSVFSKIHEGTHVVVKLPKEAALDLH